MENDGVVLLGCRGDDDQVEVSTDSARALDS